MTNKYAEFLGVLSSKGIDSNFIDKHIKSLWSRDFGKHIKLVENHPPEINEIIICLKQIDAVVHDHLKQYKKLTKPLKRIDAKKITDGRIFDLEQQHNESLLK
jgi:hypothetical protein